MVVIIVMKGRAGIALTLFLVIFVLFYVSCDSGKNNIYTVALVDPNKGTWPAMEGFISGMSDYGYIEGKNIHYIRIDSDVDLDKKVSDLVSQKVDLFFTATTPATRLVQKATIGTHIPVVFFLHDPVESGIVRSLTHPEGNVTGIKVRGSTPKALQWLTTIAPKTKHIFVPISYDTRANEQSLEDLEGAAKTLGIKITVARVETPAELDTALESMPEDIDAIFTIHSILVASNIDKVVDAAINRGIPLGSSLGKIQQGITITYSPEHDQIGKQASRLAYRIIKGNKPSDLPVEVADFYLGINLKSAKAIGLEIPEDVLKQADFIVR